MTKTYRLQIGNNYEIPLPDEFCEEFNIIIGDILRCELINNSKDISLVKHDDQTLSDTDIIASGNLTRVIPYEQGK
ncbi:MAG: hypothetical protein COB83_12775 [Gammaproteobacteria bacterium]|nr:MAG: hypothetical protein COB83_12775 [Gammaproteobacteria bacterium]